MADPLDPQMQAVPWIYTVQTSGQSLATFLGDVKINGIQTFQGGYSTGGPVTLAGPVSLTPGPVAMGTPGAPTTFTGNADFTGANLKLGPASLTAAVSGLPYINNWPDPQFCIQDANSGMPPVNAAINGTIPPVPFQGNNTGNNSLVCNCNNTSQLYVGQLGYFANSDPLLNAISYLSRITAINPNVSFSITIEGYWSPPTTSVAGQFVPFCRGEPSSSGASGNITSNVQRSTTANNCSVWISDNPAHTALLKSCLRVLIVQLGADGQSIYWRPPNSMIGAFAGQSRAFGCAVCCLTAGATATPFLNFGPVITGPAATTPGRTWVTVAANIPAGSNHYNAGISLAGPNGSWFVIGEFTECYSPIPLPDGAFSTPRAQHISFLASVSPWNGQQITFNAAGNFVCDMKQISSGMINEGTTSLQALLEGQSQTAGQTINLYRQYGGSGGSSIYSLILHQVLVGADSNPLYYAFTQGASNVYLDDQARFEMGGQASALWKHVSFDIGGATLFTGP